ncbi:MAG: hypothetical protein IJB65_03045 [Clostridia bacterium]|nr:hypothetical protein [Clostridia bacterium]
MLQPMHISGDESTDNAFLMTGWGGMGIYKLVRYIQKYRAASAGAVVPKLEDACSLYRGGSYDTANEAELTELLNDLTDGKHLGEPFEFYGNNSDLSYFWYKNADGSHIALSREMVNSIEDSVLRIKVHQTMVHSYADGLLNYDGEKQLYTLTEKGLKRITNPDFVLSRLSKEAGIAFDRQQEADAVKRQAERGFTDCHRVTVDIESLDASVINDELRCRIPGTKGKEHINYEKGSFFPMENGKTYEVYIHPEKQYGIISKNGAELKTVLGKELAAHYDIKRQAVTVEKNIVRDTAPKTAPSDELTVIGTDGKSYTVGSMKPNLESFEMEFKALASDAVIEPERLYVLSTGDTKSSVKGEELLKDYTVKQNAVYSQGQTVYASSPYEQGLFVNEYKVSDVILDRTSGECYFKLAPSVAGKSELLLPQSADGKILFGSKEVAAKALSTEAGKTAALQTKEALASAALGKTAVAPITMEASKHAVAAAASTAVPGAPLVSTAATTVNALIKQL